MKKHIKIFWLFFVLIIIFSCNKRPFDYRNKFIGDWDFAIIIVGHNWGSINDSSMFYSGNIRYGENEDEILIKYSSIDSITLQVSKDGTLSGLPSHYSNGEVGRKRLDLFLRWGGLGAFLEHSIKGKKK